MTYQDQLSPDQGSQILLDFPWTYDLEEIHIKQGLGRILAEDVVARIDVPSFDKSPYDGYALKAENTKGASKDQPIAFEIIEEIPAGAFPKKALGDFQAAKILTGSALPQGANCIIKFEATDFTEREVFIKEEVTANSNVVTKGESMKKGQLLLEKGSRLDSPSLGVLASQGIEKISVYKKPKLGFFLSGSELKEVGQDLEPGQIYDSNHLTFVSIFKTMGFDVKSYGLVPDDFDQIVALTQRAVDECDLVVTTGGASVGDYDYSSRAVEILGGQILFTRTAMKPGGSLVASRLKDKTVLNLSGNPASAILGLFRVCLPYLKKLLGYKDLYCPSFQAILKEPMKKKSPRIRILRGNLEYAGGKVYFVEKSGQGNGVLSSFVDCQVFAEVPAGTAYMEAGDLIKVYLVDQLF
ncbi:MAG: molybdopterin molybdotransferase MoeA [Bacillota bacterium]|nr:molybdopterin molybdotransferase MoeA [Bacillota bacterium]